MTITIRQRTDGRVALTIAQDGAQTDSVHPTLFKALRRLLRHVWGKGVWMQQRKAKEAA